jgi:hypothetical protein
LNPRRRPSEPFSRQEHLSRYSPALDAKIAELQATGREPMTDTRLPARESG